MIHASEVWDMIQTHMPRGRRVALQEIYQIVEDYGDLDAEDFEPESPTSDRPKWQRNVRNVLQDRKGKGEIRWVGRATYLLR